MYLHNVFEEIKAEVANKIISIHSPEDFIKFYEWLEPHKIMVEQINKLQDMSLEFSSETSLETSVDNLNETIDVESSENALHTDDEQGVTPLPDTAEETKEEESYPIGREFPFIKKAFGGIIEGLDYALHEDYVRSMQLENEYKVKITGIKGQFQNRNPKYSFIVSDKSTRKDNPLLSEVEQGIVELVGKRYVVTKTTTGSICINENPAALYIKEDDVRRFDIQAGDIINGRFYTNNITNSFRVTYKYDIVNDSQPSVEGLRLTYRQNNKEDDKDSGLAMLDRLDTTPFRNQNILLIGLASRKSDFKDMLRDNVDINLNHLTGDEHKASIQSQIMKADIVLISTRENSHDSSKYVASICNEQDIPFTSTHADGLFGVLQAAKEQLDLSKGVHAYSNARKR